MAELNRVVAGPGGPGASDRVVVALRRLAALAVIVLAAQGCVAQSQARRALSSPVVLRQDALPTPVVSPVATAPPATTVARALVSSVSVFPSPDGGTPAKQTLENPRPLGGPLILVVLERRTGWLRVALPVRPNGSTGWVRATDFSLSQHTFRIVVELKAHRITVYQGASVIDEEPIAVGGDATPTPAGTFYTVDAVRVVPPNGPYGPYAFGLSGFSDVLTSFGGGPGQLALHGTDEPWLLGRDVSHGCVRLSNAGITKLATTLPLGVPVVVLA